MITLENGARRETLKTQYPRSYPTPTPVIPDPDRGSQGGLGPQLHRKNPAGNYGIPANGCADRTFRPGQIIVS